MRLKGFSLVEIIVAVALFALFIIPIGFSINQSVKVTSKAKVEMDVNQILNDAVEKIYEQVRTSAYPSNGSIGYDFDNNVYEVNYSCNITKSNYDIIVEGDSQNSLTVYKKVYSGGNIVYQPAGITVVSSPVNLDVYYDEGSNRAEYKFSFAGVFQVCSIDFPSFNILWLENKLANSFDVNVDGIFRQNSTSRYPLLLINWGEFNNFHYLKPVTISDRVEFFDTSTSSYFNQLVEVSLEIKDSKRGVVLKRYKFMVRR